MGRRHLRLAVAAAALTALSLLAAAPSYALLAAPTATTTAIGSPVPAFAWTAVTGAARYEFQLSDSGFNPPTQSLTTRNTRATLTTTLADGTWLWRVRAIDANGNPGPWSDTLSWDKATSAPSPVAPLDGDTITYPTPVVLKWDVFDGASKYKVKYGDDLNTLSAVTPIETAATSFSPTSWLKPGLHYWSVASVDAKGHISGYSDPLSFTWVWPSAVTGLTVTDGVDGSGDAAADAALFEPRLSWDSVPGAVSYDVEVSTDSNFSAGSTKFSKLGVVGTTISPNKILPNATGYYWRVRANDASGYAGDWTVGDPFDQTYDTALPTVPNLRMRDLDPSGVGTDTDPVTDGYQTQVPIVSWDPVPGASYYDVQVQTYSDSLVGCDWTSGIKWNVTTRNTSWTPFAASAQKLAGIIPNPTSDGSTEKLVTGVNGRYCVRVRPERDGTVNANFAYVDNGDGTGWGFEFTGFPTGSACQPSCETGFIGQDDFLEPQSGTLVPRLPLFVWNPISGAQSYHVLVSTDPTFATAVIDYGVTRIPAYAPRAMASGAFPDFSVPLYWKVIPSPNANGSGVVVDYRNGAYETFNKQTVAPTQLAPASGSTIDGHPTFSWAPSEAAAKYELEVATGTSLTSTFASSTIQDDVTTYATSYTSETKSYPQDKGTLWWRVRAIDAKGNAGAWSAAWSFTQTYDVPTFTGYSNPTAGAMIPLWEWDPVANAVSYDIDIICSGTGASCTDGSNFETTATSLVKMTGLGLVQWRVRANFAATFGVVHGAYSAVQSFDRSIPAPTNLATQTGLRSVLFSWDSRPGAKQYKVQVSRSTSFTSTFQSITTDNTSFAPSLDSTDYLNGGTFYWRVAEVDNDGNQGQWSSPQAASQPAKIVISTSPGYIQHGVYTTVVVTVKDFAGHVVAGATVKAGGAGAGTFSKTTSSLGRASFKLKPTRKGYITFTVTKLNYQKATKTITVY